MDAEKWVVAEPGWWMRNKWVVAEPGGGCGIAIMDGNPLPSWMATHEISAHVPRIAGLRRVPYSLASSQGQG